MIGRSVLITVMALLVISLVNAESFSVDPCAGDTIITEDGLYYYFESPCFNIQFPKAYHQPISFFDKYNDQSFSLKMLLLREINNDLPAQKRTTAFDSLSLSANVVNNELIYTSSDGKIRLIYSIDKNKVKAGLEIDDFTGTYTNTKLQLQTLTLKGQDANAQFFGTVPVVDGIQKPIVIETEIIGLNQFMWQDLFDGNSFSTLVVDPIYQVDYSPIPAKHLITGDVNTYSDSQFISVVDITTHMGDNLTVTSYNTNDAGVNGDAISGAWSQTYDSQFSWFLRAYKTNIGSSGTPTVYAYLDSDNLSSNFTNYVSVSGIGWKNFEVDSQMDYMTNVLGLNYTKLRMYTANNGDWSEMRLRKEFNDTQSPIIHNCWIEESPVFCDGQARWSCNITDNLDVDSVIFTINGTNYSATQNNQIWYYNMDFTDTIPINETLTLTDVYATDIMNQSNHSSESEAINHDCQRIRLIYPSPGILLDENTNVALTVDLLEANLDTVWANITCPNGTSLLLYNFSKGLTSDNFETDTEGTKWEKSEQIEIGQSCDFDIDGINPGKMTLYLDASNISSTVQCAYNSIPKVDGNFDAIIDFNITTFEEDTFLTFRSAPTDSLSAVGIRAYIVIMKKAIGAEYRFGYNDGINATQVAFVDTTDTYGKMRIKRSNMNGILSIPTYNLYFWNNTIQEWVDPVGDIELPGSARIQYLQIKPGSQGSTYGKLNMTIDDFSLTTDNYTFGIIERVDIPGRVNLTIIANWTTSETNQTETWINVTAINDVPSRPFFEEPDVGEQIGFGIFNIIWGLVIDEEGDAVQFNITLLNPNFTFNSTIISNYGNINTTTFPWNTTAVPEGNYSMEIKVFENETIEKLSTTETLAGTFSVLNITCVENWITQYGLCLINDTQLKYYTDNNSCGTFDNLPGDNGTYIICNYCTSDVEKSYTSVCAWNGTHYAIDYEWVDNNYFSCCALTSIVEDCPTDYTPYNETGTELCSFLENDFEVTYESTVYYEFLDKKVYWKFNLNDTNNTYKCQSYVQTTSSDLLQVNPTYTKKSSTLINIGSSNIEDRSYFTVENGIGQAYFTQENLIVDGRIYVYGVECSSEGGIVLTSERLVTPLYEPLHEPITRFVWFQENVLGIFVLTILIILFMGFVGWVIYKIRRK